MRVPSRDTILSVATAFATLSALTVATVRVRNALHPAVRSHAASSAIPVLAWRRYAQDGIRLGPATSRVTIVEFSDFLCPFCKKAQPEVAAILRRYPQDVALVFRHLPAHERSAAAAQAAACAARFSRFERLRDILFAESDSIGRKPLARFARQAGLTDTAAFTKCVSEKAVRDAVLRDRLAATQLGAVGTPAFLVNERLIMGYNPGELTQYVVNALNEQRE